MHRKRSKQPAKSARGIYKLAIYFVDHKHPTGQAYYFYSTERQDQNRTGQRRLKYLVTKKWAGLVSWAGLYLQNQLIEEFKIADNRWQEPSKAAK